jgi:ATP-dependent 26S proteasome regulatory subunit
MATNRIDILDSALLRPGRIDRKIEFPNPNESSRADILRIHSRKMNLTRGIDLKKIADKMTGASGAELKACCTEAGMFALRERRVHVTQEDFEMAVSKVGGWVAVQGGTSVLGHLHACCWQYSYTAHVPVLMLSLPGFCACWCL